MSKLPEKIETHSTSNEGFTYRRDPADVHEDIVDAINMLIDYLTEATPTDLEAGK